MAEPWTDVTVDIVKGSGFLRLVPCTMNGSTITAFDSANKVDILQITDEDMKLPSLAPKYEELTTTLSTGNILVVPKSSIRISAGDGYQVGENLEYSFEIKGILQTTKWKKINEKRQYPFAAMRGLGYTPDDTFQGIAYLIGYIEDLSFPTKEGFNEITLTVKGGRVFKADTGVTYTSFNTAMSGNIEAVGRPAQTPLPITSSDFNNLLQGKIVIVTP